MHREIYRMYSTGNIVVVQLALQGTHLGPLNLPNGILRATGKPEEAVACWHPALALKADCAEAHHNLGNLLRRQNKLEEAVRHYRAAVRAKPDYAGAHGNLGAALAELGHPTLILDLDPSGHESGASDFLGADSDTKGLAEVLTGQTRHKLTELVQRRRLPVGLGHPLVRPHHNPSP